jgi:hypothetical protein
VGEFVKFYDGNDIAGPGLQDRIVDLQKRSRRRFRAFVQHVEVVVIGHHIAGKCLPKSRRHLELPAYQPVVVGVENGAVAGP